MGPISFALRRPMTVVIALVAIVLGCALAVWRMEVDVFPSLNLPVIYVSQPYGGMDPAQMEGFLADYYEYHFLYIKGTHHVEWRNIQGLSLMKLFFHPGTNMAQAMAETVSYVNRARSFMLPGTVPPFVMRFDTGSRLRAILMTTCAMTVGMLPMALAIGESGQQNAPLGRAVIGGLAAATLATLFVLPSVFALVQSRASAEGASLDPDDPESAYYVAPQ